MRPRWLVEITKFYSGFSPIFINRFKAPCEANEISCAFDPKIRKTIGDEIVFVITASSADQTAACVNAFMDAYIQISGNASECGPATRHTGCRMGAEFPVPDSTINLARLSAAPQVLFIPDDENNADHKPIEFDFFGTAIDTGFKIAQLSRPARMVITLSRPYENGR